MDWLAKMHAAIDYVEAHLTEKVDLDLVCQSACSSPYQFQRVFPFVTGITLAEYIGRRKLTEAASELYCSSRKIADIAIKYGYQSAASFARAFRMLYGATPAAAKRAGVKLKAYPPLALQVPDKKGLDCRIEAKEGFDVFGMETIVSLTGMKGLSSPEKLWRQCRQNGEYQRLLDHAGDSPSFVPQGLCKIHGVENYRKTEENTYSYMMCAFVSGGSKAEGYGRYSIPAQTYAVFPSEAFSWDDDLSEVLMSLRKRVFSEWLLTTDYEMADGPAFEVYGSLKKYPHIELWVPIIVHKKVQNK